MSQRSCIFCGASGPLTGEHVIPVWLQQHVGGKEKGKFRGTHLSWIGMPLSQRIASPNSHTLGTVCAACNNGWMSRLESAFRPLLPRLQAGETPRHFSKAERRTIARWIIKTGIIAHRSSNYRPILPDSFPLRFAKGNVIPAGIKVFSGKLASKKSVQWLQSNVTLFMIRESDVGNVNLENNTFVFALSIVNVFIGFAWHGLDKADFEISYTANDTHQIYPHPERAKRLNVLDDLFFITTTVGLRRRRV